MHLDAGETRGRAVRALEERVGPARTAAAVPLEVTARDLPGEPHPFASAVDGPFTAVAPGDRWGSPWSTRWFRIRGSVPEGWPIDETEVVAELGFRAEQTGFQLEGLAYTADGRRVKGVHPASRWIPAEPVLDEHGRIDVLIEAAANPVVLHIGAGGMPVSFRPTPAGDPATAGDDPQYRFEGAALVRRDPAVAALFADLEVAIQLEAQLTAGSTRSWALLTGIERCLDVLDAGPFAEVIGRARAVLATAVDAPASRQGHRISAIGHSHIDSAWLWPFRETRRKVARTIANVLHLLDTDPQFRFTMSSAQQLAWLQEDAPDLFARIRPYVEQGRFLPVGGMWVESDTNMPSGESLVRQFVEGGEFFATELGVADTEIGWLPDSFGYPGGLPQILRQAGARRFVTQKISWNRTNRFPHHTFRWEGIDGSVVLTHFPSADTYNSDLSGHDLAWAEANFADKAGSNRSLVPFGYGDGGGGPTREMMERARRTADVEGSPRVVVEPPAAFFAAVEAEFPEPPVWSGELYLEFHRGVLTSQAAMKEGNRAAEAALHDAELWAATAAVQRGAPYPQDELRALWRRLLLLQFHDVLPGSSIAWVHDEARVAFREILAGAEAVTTAALAALGEGSALANASPFLQRAVPPMSIAEPGPAASAVELAEEGAGWRMENEHLIVRIGADGLVRSLVDTVTGRDLVAPGGRIGLLQLHPDHPVRWDAWDLDGYYRATVQELDGVDGVEAATDGDGAAVRIRRSVGDTRILQTVRLRPGAKVLDLEAEVDWQERERILKASHDLDVAAGTWEAETQFGHIARPTHVNTSWDAAKFEACAHRWIRIAEGDFGVAVANRRTYGHEVRRVTGAETGPWTVARLSLLRAPRFPDPETDRGTHRFAWSVGPAPTVADAVEQGWRLAHPLRPGAAPVEALVGTDRPDLVVDTVKLALDGSGDVVVRLHNAAEGRRRGRLRFGFPVASVRRTDLRERALPVPALEEPWPIELPPFRFVTLRIARG
ncbi:glycoside hydrolase family 38 C-terminal domain-containing protein [Amnibacterium sp.]|uniref:alpha-mannosidase n=1 Tax=Amnibacterium sp. TaxID=1872496 RepID=UPI00263027F5|nr:glycoside hydrolase family 38 C-terminal domain-containing protein [Amnibacterium sp.]MCU1473107.1 alpha-mannosidase [Amnibacterium sp.]